jgi:hypothetical protein
MEGKACPDIGRRSHTEAAMSDVNVNRDVNGSLIITGHGNLVIKIDNFILNNYDDQRQSEIEAYVGEYFESLKEAWQEQLEQGAAQLQKSGDQPIPRASAYLWRELTTGGKELTSTIRAFCNGETVQLKDPDIKLRASQAEMASKHGQPLGAISQTSEELIENLSELVSDDLDESSKNKLILSLSLPDIEAERLIQLEIDYRRKAYCLKVGLQTLAGEHIHTPTNITLFYKASTQREVCRYTMRHGEIVQIPEIEPGRYNFQIVSRETLQLLWKMDLELGSVMDRLM